MVVPLGCLGFSAIYFNFLIGLINTLVLIRLFTIPTKKGIYLKPWKVLFIIGIIFLVEELFVFLRALGMMSVPLYVDGYFGLIIIALFLYMVMLQREHVKKVTGDKGKQKGRGQKINANKINE